MEDATKTQEVFNQATGKVLETMTVWAEASQRVLRDLVELSAGAAKESIHLCSELQQSAIDAIREGQASAVRWQSDWPEAAKDPGQWYQKAVADGVDGTQKVFRVMESNAQAVSKSAERLQASAEQAGKSIQATYGGIVSKTKDIYSRS